MNNQNTIVNINSLLNLTVGLYNSDDEGFILNSTLLSLMGKLKILRAAVYIQVKDHHFTPIIIKGSFPLSEIPIFELNEFKPAFKTIHNDLLQDIGVEYLIPVQNNDNFYALICLGKSITKIELSEDEIDYINLISAIAANAIRNARTMHSFKRSKVNVEQRNQLLTTLFEISKDFSSNFSANRIIKTLALNLMGQLTVSRFAVFTKSGAGVYETVVNRFGYEFNQSYLDIMSEPVFATDVKQLTDYNQIKNDVEKLGVMIVAPMIVQGNTRGLLVIGKKMNGMPFSDENLMFIEAIGNSAIAALENERLFHEELEKKRIESELSIALEIQKNLLPSQSPILKNYEIAGISIPSRHVGGDLFDYIQLDENRHLIAIADVSGKGIPASLIMANFQAALQVLSVSELSLTDVVLRINSLLCTNTSADKFVTAFFCIIDDSNKKITYINAGHNPPLLKRNDGTIDQLNLGGIILGFMKVPFDYESGEIWLNKGESLILYTDGVTEATNKEQLEYGEEQLELFMQNIGGLSADQIIDTLIEDVEKHLDKMPQNDDITLVVINGI